MLFAYASGSDRGNGSPETLGFRFASATFDACEKFAASRICSGYYRPEDDRSRWSSEN